MLGKANAIITNFDTSSSPCLSFLCRTQYHKSRNIPFFSYSQLSKSFTPLPTYFSARKGEKVKDLMLCKNNSAKYETNHAINPNLARNTKYSNLWASMRNGVLIQANPSIFSKVLPLGKPYRNKLWLHAHPQIEILLIGLKKKNPNICFNTLTVIYIQSFHWQFNFICFMILLKKFLIPWFCR